MVSVDFSKENIIKYGTPTSAGALGYFVAPSGLEILFICLFVGLSFIPLKRILTKELRVVPPVFVPKPVTQGIPGAIAPDSDWWKAIIDLANCSGKRCDICSYYRPVGNIKCA